MMTRRNILRLIAAAVGIVQIVLLLIDHERSAMAYLFPLFLFFIAGTNFCRECPIVFFTRRAYWKMKGKEIPVRKM